MKFYLFIFFGLLNHICIAQGQIEGNVLDKTTGKPLINTNISLWTIDSIRYDSSRKKAWGIDPLSSVILPGEAFIDTTYKRVQRQFSDSAGYYIFHNLDPNFYRVTAFHQTGEVNNRKYGEFADLSVIYINCDSKINEKMLLAVFCKYDLTRDSTHCPRCHKKDKLLIIRNGLFPVGYNYKEEPGYYYSGYCVVKRCHATKRCMRCEHEF